MINPRVKRRKMASCVVCNYIGSNSNNKFLDGSIPNEERKGSLRVRLERILDEGIVHEGYLCSLCFTDLKQIETYYTLLTFFRKRYRQTCGQKERGVLHVSSIAANENKSHGGSWVTRTARVVETTGSENLVPLLEIKPDPDGEGHEHDTELGSLSLPTVGDDSDYENDTHEFDDAEENELEKTPQPGDETTQPIDETLQSVDETPQPLKKQNSVKRPLDLPKAYVVLKDIFSEKKLQKNETAVNKPNYVTKPNMPTQFSDTLMKDTGTKKKIVDKDKRQCYFCDKCGKGFKWKKDLRRHSIIHTDDKPFACDKCEVTVRYKSALGSHVQQHTTGAFPCPKCTVRFGTWACLMNHIDHSHKEIVSSYLCKCSVCGEEVEEQFFRHHMKTHIEKVPLKNPPEKSVLDTDKEEPVTKDQSEEAALLEVAALECPTCKALFTSQRTLRGHLQVHEKKSYPCPICSKRYPGTYNVKHHILGYHKLRQASPRFNCSVCETEIGYLDMIKHIQTHVEDTTGEEVYEDEDELLDTSKSSSTEGYACSVCKQIFRSKWLLEAHSELHQLVFFPCPMCAKRYPGIMHLMDHIRKTHEEFKPGFQCSCKVCNADVPYCDTPIHVKFHVEERSAELAVTSRKEIDLHKFHDCPICYKWIPTPGCLITHLQETHNIARSNKEHHCEKCGMDFTFAIALDAHMNIHKEEISDSGTDKDVAKEPDLKGMLEIIKSGSFTCTICNHTLTTRHGLVNHMKMHTGDTVKCPVCAKQVPTKGTLRYHMAVHSDDKPFLCKICGNRYKHKGLLKSHKRETHQGLKRKTKIWFCELCGKKFHANVRLQDHLKKHKGERPYECTDPSCRKNFSCRLSLKAHLRIHTGVMKYGCDICKKRFVQQGQLKSHMYTHTSDRNFKCQTCLKRFKRYQSLWTHEKLHRGDMPHKCQYCGKGFSQAGHKRRHENTQHLDITMLDESEEDAERNSNSEVQHEKSHGLEKPHNCKFCSRSFAHGSDQRRHESSRHSKVAELDGSVRYAESVVNVELADKWDSSYPDYWNTLAMQT